MVRRTKEEALETRNRILDAAEDVFYARGVARTSLSDIAQAAGVTRGAIYWHFRNKADVFAAMCERVKLPMETMCSPPGVEANDPLGELRTVGNFLLRQLVEDAHWRKVFEIMFNKCEFVEDTSPILKRQQESFEEGMARLSSIIEQATRRGQLPADLDIPLAVAQFHASFNGIMGDFLFYPDASALASKRERLMDACIDTLKYSPALRLAQPAMASARTEAST
ncbi:TetR family transcriptional regulator [Ralstonia sp. A12]|uniref:TetR family transcriptional regulator n=1 Tax=Ralstonia sp. A12 TaxID=1217052 RepID=UPI0005746175|nr:TetR family transcriptional regulator [Ralstonia sp. A12]KHK57374.1 TetR family transcriptional regulator [Ralstonia sp. A12]